MARFPSYAPPDFAALLVAGALAQPTPAMEVTINEVQSSVRTNDGGSRSYLGGLVKSSGKGARGRVPAQEAAAVRTAAAAAGLSGPGLCKMGGSKACASKTSLAGVPDPKSG